MENTVLFFSDPACPHSSRLWDYIDKRDSHSIKARIKKVTTDSKYDELWTRHDVKDVPALVMPDGKKLVGEEAFKWFESQLVQHGQNPSKIMSPYPTEYHIGNKRFVVAVILLLILVKASPCDK